MHNPRPHCHVFGYLDMALLAGVLCFATWALFRKRSRLAVLLTAVLSLLYFGFARQGCVCPVGSLQNVALALADPGYRIPLAVLVFFALPLAFALFVGRVFCGAACPLGILQDLVVWKPVRVPRWVETLLGMVPPLFLGLAVLYAAAGNLFLACRMDPFVGFFRFSASAELLFLGGLLLLAGVFLARPYCRFVCPYGVLLGWASFFAKHRVQVTPTTCLRCRLCENACPFDAIHHANPNAESESPRGRMRRFVLTLLVVPVLLAVFTWGGGQLQTRLAEEHPTVVLAERIRAEEEGRVAVTTLASREFRKSARTIPALYEEARGVRSRFRIGSYGLGLFLGLVLSGRLLAGCIRRYHEAYTVNRMQCYSCGRCYAYCPQQKGQS